MKDGEPCILIECKHWDSDMNLYDNQLLRYFHVSKAKFGILTNGVLYRFYTDLETPNKMDEKPFLEVNMLDLKESQIEEIKKFHKSYFDVDNILNSASELKYTRELKTLITNEFQNPSLEFVKLFAKKAYEGVITAKLLDQFTGLVKKSIASHINDLINERLKSALNQNAQEVEEKGINEELTKTTECEIITTEEEKEAYTIIKSIVRTKISPERLTYRDSKSYCAIIVDDNNRKILCRLYLGVTNKYVGIIDENKTEQKQKIDSINDIFNLSEILLKAAERFIN